MDTARSGFTLLELLIVIGLLGVLTTILVAVVNPVSQFAKARDAQRKTDLDNIQKALELYYNDNGEYPPGNNYSVDLAVLVPDYIQTLPNDPSGNTYAYEQLAVGGPAGQAYHLYSSLERCRPGACFDVDACHPDPNNTNPPDEGNACNGAGSLSCGAGVTCTYGVASSNVAP